MQNRRVVYFLWARRR